MTSGGKWSTSERRAHEREVQAANDIARVLDECSTDREFVLKLLIGIGQSQRDSMRTVCLRKGLKLLMRSFDIEDAEIVLQVK